VGPLHNINRTVSSCPKKMVAHIHACAKWAEESEISFDKMKHQAIRKVDKYKSMAAEYKKQFEDCLAELVKVRSLLPPSPLKPARPPLDTGFLSDDDDATQDLEEEGEEEVEVEVAEEKVNSKKRKVINDESDLPGTTPSTCSELFTVNE
jgi:hypothetical protein